MLAIVERSGRKEKKGAGLAPAPFLVKELVAFFFAALDQHDHHSEQAEQWLGQNVGD
jgi:hypothetical protein